MISTIKTYTIDDSSEKVITKEKFSKGKINKN